MLVRDTKETVYMKRNVTLVAVLGQNLLSGLWTQVLSYMCGLRLLSPVYAEEIVIHVFVELVQKCDKTKYLYKMWTMKAHIMS